ncbi:MAG: hypothetical protein IKH74_04410, partial [Lachnospiraceae bacterium]|nr:hypothetical protein [Lachnospiraceae bacterium]
NRVLETLHFGARIADPKAFEGFVTGLSEDNGLLPYFILQCGAKFIGFRLGKRYPKLKPGFVKKCSSNRAYWERFYGQNQSNAE